LIGTGGDKGDVVDPRDKSMLAVGAGHDVAALEAAVDRLKNEAWAGELLRRARWEINTLSPALPRR
jgi:hypothetical protein